MPEDPFYTHGIKNDPFLVDAYNEQVPILDTSGLVPHKSSSPRLSILMNINDWRRNQLARSLECLCRQTWRNFEVLICDNGSSLDLGPVISTFQDLMPLKVIRLERSTFSACPTLGFKKLMPMARGEVVAIVQPEMMFAPTATDFLYSAHFGMWPPPIKYKIAHNGISTIGRPTWATMKPWFLDKDMTMALDGLDWHGDLSALHDLPSFWDLGIALGTRTNRDVVAKLEWPWWFAASALRDDPIWEAMPEFEGHASIDFWLLNYRRENQYVDIVPAGNPLCYHQDHTRENSAPIGEAERASNVESMSDEEFAKLPLADAEELLELCAQYASSGGSTLAMLDYFRYMDDDRPPSVSRPGVLGVTETEKSVRIRRIEEANQGT